MSDRALHKVEAARLLGLSPKSLQDRRWRLRVGLKATRVGRCLRFRESDLLKLLARGLERHPGEVAKGGKRDGGGGR